MEVVQGLWKPEYKFQRSGSGLETPQCPQILRNPAFAGEVSAGNVREVMERDKDDLLSCSYRRVSQQEPCHTVVQQDALSGASVESLQVLLGFFCPVMRCSQSRRCRAPGGPVCRWV